VRNINCTIALLAIVMLLVFTGCVPRSTKPDVILVPEMGEGQIAGMLDYVNNVLSLPPSAQAAARDNLLQQYKLSHFPEDRMRLALLDSLLPEPVRNEDQAIALVSGYNWEALGPGFKGLASLVLNISKSLNAQTAADQSLVQQLASERSQKDRLQQQLDALKNIEKAMDKHDKPIVNPQTPTKPAAASTSKGPQVHAPSGDQS
jgi:hypothetical protein